MINDKFCYIKIKCFKYVFLYFYVPNLGLIHEQFWLSSRILSDKIFHLKIKMHHIMCVIESIYGIFSL
jgi:hypothetical protein